MTTTRNYAAEYKVARLAYLAPTATHAEIAAARKLSEKIDRAARRAGVELDVITLDEQARVELYPDAPRARTI